MLVFEHLLFVYKTDICQQKCELLHKVRELVAGNDSSVAVVDDRLALLLIVERTEGEKLYLKLLELVEHSVHVCKNSALAGFESLHKSAVAAVLNLKSGGLVLDIPLLLEGAVKNLNALNKLGIILVCKAFKLILVVRLISVSRSETELVFDLKCLA